MFVQEVKLLLAKAVTTHSLSQVAGETQVMFQTEFRGPLAFFYASWIGPNIKKKISIEMENMLKKAKLLQTFRKTSPAATRLSLTLPLTHAPSTGKRHSPMFSPAQTSASTALSEIHLGKE